MRIGCLFYTATALAALGCAGTSTQQGPVSVPRPISTVDSTSRVDSTTHRASLLQLFHPGNAQYDYRSVSLIRVTVGDTIPRADTISVSGLVGAKFQSVGTENLTIQASISTDSVVIRTGTSMPLRFATQVDTVRIHTATGKVAVQSFPTNSCEVQTQEALVRIDDLIPVVLPTQVRTWSDTVARQVCRGGIQLQTRRVTSYQLDSTTAELRLLRIGVTTFSGRGSQWNQPVEASGQSISTDTLVLDLTNRQRIQQIRGTTQLKLSFKSQLRNQQFDQSTQLFVQLR